MNDRRRILVSSVVVLAGGMICTAAVAITILYRTALEEERAHLAELARSQARLIEAVLRHDEQHDDALHPAGSALNDTTSIIADAHGNYNGIGETGELVVARREGDQIVFLFPYRHADGGDPDPVPWTSGLAEPMRLALSGQEGALVGLDYRGESVLAAHAPVEASRLGVVAKMDMAELRAPFVRAGLVAGGVTVLLVLVGVGLALRVIDPMLRRLGLFQRFAEESGHGLAMADLDRRIIYVNRALCRMLGVERPADVLGKRLESFYAEEVGQRIIEEIVPAVLEEGQWKGELAQVSTKGQVCLTLQDIFLIRSEKGSPLCLVDVIMDITERKRTEERLRDSEKRSRAWLENSPVCTKIVDLSFDLQYMSRAGIEGLGIDDITLFYGQPYPLEFYPESFKNAMTKSLEDVRETGEVITQEASVVDTGGKELWFHSTIVPVCDDEGRIDYIIIVSIDITERKRAEERLHRYEHIVASSTDMLALLDTQYVYLAANEAYAKVLQKGQADLIGHTVPEVLGKDVFEMTIKPNAERCLGGEEVHYQAWFEFPTHGRRYMDISYFPFVDENGQVSGFAVHGRDITERKRAEEERLELEAQLRQSQKLEAVGQLAGGVAHDFNNLLTAIFGNTELAVSELKSEFRDATQAIDGLDQIRQSAERAAALTKQLLTFSRRQVIEPQVLSLNTILTDLDKMLRRLITENIALETITDPSLQPVRADAGQLEQVIVNLVVNAAHAMPDGGRLILESRNVTLDEEYASRHAEAQPGPCVLLAVSDTGHGMDAATRERIFEPFFTTKSVDKGTGLGLATVHGIVKQSGGHVEVYSEPGRGSTFKVYLPAFGATPANQTPIPQPETLPHGHETVLLCEDDQSVRELTAQALRVAGYTVMTAGNGQEGIEVARNYAGSIDLLITDVIMPDLNGRALSECLRATIPGLPTLFISGYASNIIAHHGVLEEDIEFLQKPFMLHDLLTKVRAVLGKARSSV